MSANPNPLPPMGRHQERFWTMDDAVPVGQRKAGKYNAFIPADIAAMRFAFDGTAANAIGEAGLALSRLQETAAGTASLASLARNLLRSESAASSRIEGIQISQERLARAAYERSRTQRSGDRKAAEVLGNVDAMDRAIELGAKASPFTAADIIDIHQTLLRFTDDHAIAGVVRQRQNWIGGSDYHPLGAAYIPPPHEYVESLLDDLCAFVQRTDLPPVAQAAIAHAQFENIHPFMDGNGRTGRALIYAVLRRRGTIPNYVPPISLALGAQPKAYVSGLGAYSTGKVSAWCERFAGATIHACEEARRLAAAIAAEQERWLRLLGNPRRDSAARQLVALLPGQPILDVPAGQQLTGKSHVAVGAAIEQLVRAGILKPMNERKWGRVWECPPLLAVAEAAERRIATPAA